MLFAGIGVILDRSIFSDEVFANVCTKEGYISKKGYGQYQFWHQRALSHLPIPHVTLFLDADPECCHSRIHRRGRECEGGVPLDYLSKLNDEYLIFLKEMKKLGSCVLSYNWTKFQDEDKIVSDILSVDITQWSEQFIKMFMLKSFNVSELFHPSTLQALET
jgi:deoxyadenosine/deoxycytidine kinase